MNSRRSCAGEVRRVKSWSDIEPKKRDVWVEKVSIKSLLGKRITITGFEVKRSTFKAQDGSNQIYTMIQFEMDGTRHFVNTGSMLIRKQLESCRDELPFTATIVRKDNWLSLS